MPWLLNYILLSKTCFKNVVLPNSSEHQQVDILTFKITIFLRNIFIKKTKQNRSISPAVSFSEYLYCVHTLPQIKLLPSSQPVGSILGHGCFPKCACPPRSEALSEKGAELHRPQVPGKHNVPSQPESVAVAETRFLQTQPFYLMGTSPLLTQPQALVWW